ncbi:unnamed protein product [Allacma fusca]|uniref:Carotenoid cleavage dioxygenase n=1 Tax=Allacma fusca TaxID=39272 RepID=A0A8J2NJ66_9HEXA|nr:unnamed protein product [Allacma fusca]
MPANLTEDKDLSPLFRSTEELEEPEEAVIEGEVPSWLNGTLFRTGPGKFDIGNFTVNHWLDGYAILSKFEIGNSKVKFHKRFLRSDAYQKAMLAGRSILTEFGTKGSADPNKNIFSRLVSSVFPVEMTDNDCVSIFPIGPDLFTTSDSCFMRKMTQDLETCEKVDTNKYFGLNGASAHPLREEDGTVYNIGFSCLTGLKFNVYKIPRKGFTSKEMMKNSKVIASIPSRWSTGLAYNHSFGMTENYLIFIEQPYIVSFSKLASSVVKGGSAFKDWLEWKSEEKNRFVVIEKSGKLIKTEYYSSSAFFFLHFINAYEQDGEIIIDINAYKSPAVLDKMYIRDLRSTSTVEEVDPPCAQRFIIPLIDPKAAPEEVNLVRAEGTLARAIKAGHVITLYPEIKSDYGLELPAINKNFLGKKANYFYAAGTVCENIFSNSLCKINLETRETQFWRRSEFMYPGEPVFIRNPQGQAEDDGVIISAVTDVSKENDFLVFIDAKSWQEIGRALFSSHVPQALHGLFLENPSS